MALRRIVLSSAACALAWLLIARPATASTVPRIEASPGRLTVSAELGLRPAYMLPMPFAVLSADYSPFERIGLGVLLSAVPYSGSSTPTPWDLGLVRGTVRIGDMFDGAIALGLTLGGGEGSGGLGLRALTLVPGSGQRAGYDFSERSYFVHPALALTWGTATSSFAVRAQVGPRINFQYFEAYRVTNSAGDTKTVEFLWPENLWSGRIQAYLSGLTSTQTDRGFRLTESWLAPSVEIAYRIVAGHELAVSTDGTLGWRGTY